MSYPLERRSVMTAEEKKMVEMIQNAYISVYGIQKWNSLTASEKHDAIMIITADALKMMGD